MHQREKALLEGEGGEQGCNITQQVPEKLLRAKRPRLSLVILLLPHLGDDDSDNVSKCHDDNDDDVDI